MTLASRRPRRVTLTRVAAFLNVFIVALLAVLMATSFMRALSARSIDKQVANLEINLAQLQQNRASAREALQAQMVQAEAELAQAEAGTPKLGAPYQLFERGFALGAASGVDILRIEDRGDDVEHTALGDLSLQTYDIGVAGDMPACLAYLTRLEAEGSPFLASDHFSYVADPQACSFSVTVLGTDTSGLPSPP
jgi:hypothetical protein